MQVILLEKFARLGGVGDQVSVKSGFARNYLIPQGKAVMATKDNIRHFEERRAELEARAQEVLEHAQDRAKQVEDLGQVTLSTKAGIEGRLFGSITTRDISAAITEAGVEVSKSEVRLPSGPLRELGSYEIEIQLHPEVDTSVMVNIEAE